MKTLKASIWSLVSAALLHTASAQTVIYIAGSNGDRVVTNTAIPKLLTGETYAGTNNDPTRANQATWTGGTFNGIPVTIKVSYIGATGGLGAVAGSLPVKFLPDGATGGSNPDPTVGSNPHQAAVPDFTMSTNFLSSSKFNGLYQGHFYENIAENDNILGVVGMKFVASPGFPGDNITTQQAQLLWGNGSAPLSLFTGNPADENKTVFATGRNTDAGQRYGAHTETGIGLDGFVKNYKPTITGAAPGVGGFTVGGTVNSHVLWPVETWSGVNSQFPGNSGESSGARLAPYLTATLGPDAYKVGNANATAGYYISYLTPGDADSIAIPNGAVELKYNGVTYSEDNIRNGKYTFWLYTHLMHRSSLAGTAKDFADALVVQIRDVDTVVAGILKSTMKVSRQAEGGLVTPNNF